MHSAATHPGEKGRLLVVQFSANRDGSTLSALMLANGFREAGWHTTLAFGSDGPMVDQFRAYGHLALIIPHKSWLRTNHSIKFIRDVLQEYRRVNAFRHVLRSDPPDLVYVNTSASLAGALAAHRQYIPCVWHLRELFEDAGGEMKTPRWARPWVRQQFKRLGERIVANSSFAAQNMVASDVFQDAIVVPNAAEERFFQSTESRAEARRRLGLPDEGIVLGVPGTLRPKKGHSFFLRAIRPLLKVYSSLCVAVTGSVEGAYAGEVQRLVRELGIERQVVFLGSVNDMPAFFRACDLVCVPSMAESFGRTVIEAFAVGTPVVATRVGGIPENVRDGENGLLVAYGDEQGLAERIERLLGDSSLRERLSANALRDAHERFRASAYKQAVCRIVEDVLQEGSTSASAGRRVRPEGRSI